MKLSELSQSDLHSMLRNIQDLVEHRYETVESVVEDTGLPLNEAYRIVGAVSLLKMLEID